MHTRVRRETGVIFALGLRNHATGEELALHFRRFYGIRASSIQTVILPDIGRLIKRFLNEKESMAIVPLRIGEKNTSCHDVIEEIHRRKRSISQLEALKFRKRLCYGVFLNSYPSRLKL